MKYIHFFVAISMLTGCSGSVITSITPDGDYSKSLTAYTKSLCILVPPDPIFEGENFSGAGLEVSRRVEESVKEMGVIRASVTYGDMESACKMSKCEYVLPVDIIHFEDHPTGYTGKPDIISIKVSIRSCLSSIIERSFTFNGKSNVITSGLFEWGNRSPLELINNEFDEQLGKLLH